MRALDSRRLCPLPPRLVWVSASLTVTPTLRPRPRPPPLSCPSDGRPSSGGPSLDPTTSPGREPWGLHSPAHRAGLAKTRPGWDTRGDLPEPRSWPPSAPCFRHMKAYPFSETRPKALTHKGPVNAGHLGAPTPYATLGPSRGLRAAHAALLDPSGPKRQNHENSAQPTPPVPGTPQGHAKLHRAVSKRETLGPLATARAPTHPCSSLGSAPRPRRSCTSDKYRTLCLLSTVLISEYH